MAKIPSIELIPSAYKSGKVYSVLPTDGSGDFNFARTSEATRVNKDGLIEKVGSNVPRLNYPLIDGVVQGCPSLLLEPERRNLVIRSEEFDNGVWNKLTNTQVNANQVISPNGSLNADELKAIATSTSLLSVEDGFGVTASTNYVVSFFAKMGSVRYVQLFNGSNQVLNNPRTNFDLQDGTITVSDADHDASIESYGNGWYRCIVKLNTNSTALQLYFNGILNSNAARSAASNFTIGDNFYLFGAQLEAGSYATSYIPTNGGTVTRVAETANGAGDASTFNDSEGVLFAEISALANDGTFRQMAISNGSSNDSIRFMYTSTDNQIRYFVRESAVTKADISTELSPAINNNKIAGKYKDNDYSFWVNGFLVDIDTSGGSPLGLNTFEFDDGGSGGGNFYGNTKQIQYFDTALNDTDLETLTSWTSFNEMAQAQLYTIQ